MFSPYELRNGVRTGAGVPEARPEGSAGPLTAGSPPPPMLAGGEALGDWVVVGACTLNLVPWMGLYGVGLPPLQGEGGGQSELPPIYRKSNGCE